MGWQASVWLSCTLWRNKGRKREKFPDRDKMRERKRTERDIQTYLSGPEWRKKKKKKRAASHAYWRKREERGVEGERRRSEKESAGDGFKLLVSQADKGSSASWLSSASHTISPLFAISPLSILLHLAPWWSNSQCDALFLSPSHSCQRYCIYIIPCHSLSYSL